MLVNPNDFAQNFFEKNIDKFSNYIGGRLNDFVDTFVVAFANNFWSSVLGFIACLIYIYMVWACFSIMMGRDKMFIPPFGESKPIDCIYFMSCFYIIVSILKAKYGVI